MIKFLGERDSRPMLGLGLSRSNCEKLLEGRPIFIDLKVMMMDVQNEPNLNDATVLIFGGETEEVMQRDLRKYAAGMPGKTHKHHEENQ